MTYEERAALHRLGITVCIEKGSEVICQHNGKRVSYDMHDLKRMARPSILRRLREMMRGAA